MWGRMELEGLVELYILLRETDIYIDRERETLWEIERERERERQRERQRDRERDRETERERERMRKGGDT